MGVVGLVKASWDSWPIADGLLDMNFSGDVSWAGKDVVESI